MSRTAIRSRNISPRFKPNDRDAEILTYLLRFEETPQAIEEFARLCNGLSDYGYWFGLSTHWVSYTGFSDLRLWRYLFSSPRPFRDECIMKPDELKAFRRMPTEIRIFRAHRAGETDWIAYTTRLDRAKAFLAKRPGGRIQAYMVKKSDCLAYFTRRGESEIIVLDRSRVRPVEVKL